MSPMQKTARRALKNARAGHELAEASASVIARRMEIVGQALADPLRADHVELGLMGAEKVEALAASAGAACVGALDLADRAGRIAAREGQAAAAHLSDLSSASSLVEAAGRQAAWNMGVWTRAVVDGWTLGGALLKAQAEALAPIHAAATANARRLKR